MTREVASSKDFKKRLAELTPSKLRLLALEQQARLAALEEPVREPVAIIGMGCRLPGGDDPQAFWELLANGVDAITEVPPERWDADAFYHPDVEAPGKTAARWGGFVRPIDRFDAAFFNISPREATVMDPQQRLFLEVAWEALEDAVQAADELAGSRTGVFVGIGPTEYPPLELAKPDGIDAYTATGNAHSIVANRLSYQLDLRGPSMALDTACSSSLVAVHLAVQSLRGGESDLALAGAVYLMLSPLLTISLSKARMLAADGRCKTFDARADGYVRGEGCGVVVLKRLSDAVRDGDRILALIRGSAINQDGRSNGLTAPNLLAQQEVLRQALANAAVAADEVSYVEAHGTGTALGDPIEIEALKAVYGRPRGKGPDLAVGSVKTNIGHTEPVAGMAGLIKTVLALRQEAIPPHLHLERLNANIDLDGTPIVIPTELRRWPARGSPRLAGVSSFGFGGTGGHLLLQEAPVRPLRPAAPESPLHLFALSARSQPALRELAGRYADHLEHRPEVPLADVCYSAGVGRCHLEHRLAAIADSRSEMVEGLRAVASGRGPAVAADDEAVAGQRPRIAFLFTGQGAQYAGMGRRLYQTQPVVRRVLERCDELLRPYLEQPLLSVLYPPPDQASQLDETACAQPALFALEVA
ncbi:MAG: type I polyketide synthase, partial [Thermoanaerobaculia bacterium]